MTPAVNKRAVAAAFGRAAQSYDRFAELQRLSGERLLACLQSAAFARVLDAGCGTGAFSRRWREQGSEVTAVDLSAQMLTQARRQQTAHHYAQGDIEALPFASERFDLIWSNLVVQWCENLSRGLGELYRVTRPGGRIAFSTLVEGSLPELHQAWRAVDENPHANRFLSADAIARACPQSRVTLAEECITLTFADALSAMRSLKGIGATHLHDGRQNRTLTRRELQRLTLAWPQRAGGFPLSYHLIFGVIERD